MSERDRLFMRGQLAAVGIFLDDKPKAKAPSDLPRHEPVPVDRDEIRRVLQLLGAPPADLDWLTASCPGIEYAIEYQPPRRDAWCPVCDGPMPCGERGCITCQGAKNA